MEKAPILVSVYNRPILFKACIESLKKNKFADKSHLFIAIDSPFKDEHKAACKEVVDYAKSIKGFKDLTLFLRKENIGSFRNVLNAIEEIFLHYDRLIFSEDDDIFSNSFLSFVNKGLDVYENRRDIFSVAGYNYPVKIPEHYRDDIYIWPGYTCWGVGIWKNKWEKVDWSLKVLDRLFENKREIKKLNNIAEHYLPHLKKIMETGHMIDDVMLSYHQYKNKMYSIFPCISRVKNMGHDGSGENCGVSNVYLNQTLYKGNDETYMPIDISPDLDIYRILWTHFRTNAGSKLRKKIKLGLNFIIERF